MSRPSIQEGLPAEIDRLRTELERRDREVAEAFEQRAALAEILEIISQSPTDLQRVLDAIVTAARHLLPSDSATIWQESKGELRRSAVNGTGTSRPTRPLAPSSVSGRALLDRKPVQIQVSRLTEEERIAFADSLPPGRSYAVLLAVPMLRDGEPIGVLTMTRRVLDEPYNDGQVALLEAFADQAVIAIENARLFSELQERNREVTEALEHKSALAEVLEIISQTPGNPQPVMQAVAELILRLVGSDEAGVLLLEGGRLRLAGEAVRGGVTPLGARDALLEIEGRVCGEVVRTGKTVHWWGPVDEFARQFPAGAAAIQAAGHSQVTVCSLPLVRDGVVVGNIDSNRFDGIPFTSSQLALLEAFADQAVIAIENARLFNQVTRQAEELRQWNQQLETRVAEKVSEVERLGRLQRFLAPQLAEVILSGGESVLESHRREITALFCDFRGFTPFAETSEPEEVMAVLGDFHGAVGPLIFELQGTLTQFSGDGLMVIFNDPIPCDEPAWRAVQLALAMQAQVEEMKPRWARRGHQLELGVGIAMGYATCGRIGFEGRSEYTAIGPVVNLAARLCGAAEPGQVLATERIVATVEDRVSAELIGELELKGIARPVRTYRLTTQG